MAKLTKKDGLSFEHWLAMLAVIARLMNVNNIDLSPDIWEDDYEDNLTPVEALNRDLGN